MSALGQSSASPVREPSHHAPLAEVKQAYYRDMNGDGRIESAFINFNAELPLAPDMLSFQVNGLSGQSAQRMANGTSIAFAPGSKSALVVAFADPFPFGITSVSNNGNSGMTHQQASIPLNGGFFRVDDSVPPVIVKAEVSELDVALAHGRIVITFSESVKSPLDTFETLVFKRRTWENPAGLNPILGMEKLSETRYAFFYNPDAPEMPVVSDSVAISLGGKPQDLLGNFPRRKLFRVLEGVSSKGRLSPPAALPVDPSFSDSVSVSISSPKGSGGRILYTLDGSVPDTEVAGTTRLYAGPIVLRQSTTIKARVVDAGSLPSVVSTFAFTQLPTVSVRRRAADKGNLWSERGRLGGEWLISHPPTSVACFDAMGVFVGWARRASAPGEWTLPSARGVVGLRLRMTDGLVTQFPAGARARNP